MVKVTVAHPFGKYKEYRAGDSGPYTPVVSTLEYTDDDGIVRSVALLKTDSTYAFRIPTERNMMEVSLVYRAFRDARFYLVSGDSLHVAFTGKSFTAATFRNGEELLTGHDATVRNDTSAYTATEKLRAPFHFVVLDFSLPPAENDRRLDAFIASLREERREALSGQLASLADQSASGVLPEHGYALRANEVAYLLGEEVLHPAAPYQAFYQDLVRDTAFALGKGFPVIKSTNGSMPDFPKVIDALPQPGAPQDSLLTNRIYRFALEEIVTHFPIADQRTYLAAYQARYGDAAFTDYLTETYRLDYGDDAGDLELLAFDGQPTTLSEIFAWAGQPFLYVDFWASWCAPCRASFPASREMHAGLDSTQVRFVYLSIDDDPVRWKQASTAEQLPTESSLLVAHAKTSRWLETYGVGSIPRYMIFRNTGEVVYPNTTGPGADGLAVLRALFTAPAAPPEAL